MDALIKKNPLICVMSVDIGNGKTGTININYNDEPAVLANDFIFQYNLDSVILNDLINYIDNNAKEAKDRYIEQINVRKARKLAAMMDNSETNIPTKNTLEEVLITTVQPSPPTDTVVVPSSRTQTYPVAIITEASSMVNNTTVPTPNNVSTRRLTGTEEELEEQYAAILRRASTTSQHHPPKTVRTSTSTNNNSVSRRSSVQSTQSNHSTGSNTSQPMYPYSGSIGSVINEPSCVSLTVPPSLQSTAEVSTCQVPITTTTVTPTIVSVPLTVGNNGNTQVPVVTTKSSTKTVSTLSSQPSVHTKQTQASKNKHILYRNPTTENSKVLPPRVPTKPTDPKLFDRLYQEAEEKRQRNVQAEQTALENERLTMVPFKQDNGSSNSNNYSGTNSNPEELTKRLYEDGIAALARRENELMELRTKLQEQQDSQWVCASCTGKNDSKAMFCMNPSKLGKRVITHPINNNSIRVCGITRPLQRFVPSTLTSTGSGSNGNGNSSSGTNDASQQLAYIDNQINNYHKEIERRNKLAKELEEIEVSSIPFKPEINSKSRKMADIARQKRAAARTATGNTTSQESSSQDTFSNSSEFSLHDDLYAEAMHRILHRFSKPVTDPKQPSTKTRTLAEQQAAMERLQQRSITQVQESRSRMAEEKKLLLSNQSNNTNGVQGGVALYEAAKAAALHRQALLDEETKKVNEAARSKHTSHTSEKLLANIRARSFAGMYRTLVASMELPPAARVKEEALNSTVKIGNNENESTDELQDIVVSPQDSEATTGRLSLSRSDLFSIIAALEAHNEGEAELLEKVSSNASSLSSPVYDCLVTPTDELLLDIDAVWVGCLANAKLVQLVNYALAKVRKAVIKNEELQGRNKLFSPTTGVKQPLRLVTFTEFCNVIGKLLEEIAGGPHIYMIIKRELKQIALRNELAAIAAANEPTFYPELNPRSLEIAANSSSGNDNGSEGTGVQQPPSDRFQQYATHYQSAQYTKEINQLRKHLLTHSFKQDNDLRTETEPSKKSSLTTTQRNYYEDNHEAIAVHEHKILTAAAKAVMARKENFIPKNSNNVLTKPGTENLPILPPLAVPLDQLMHPVNEKRNSNHSNRSSRTASPESVSMKTISSLISSRTTSPVTVQISVPLSVISPRAIRYPSSSSSSSSSSNSVVSFSASTEPPTQTPAITPSTTTVTENFLSPTRFIAKSINDYGYTPLNTFEKSNHEILTKSELNTESSFLAEDSRSTPGTVTNTEERQGENSIVQELDKSTILLQRLSSINIAALGARIDKLMMNESSLSVKKMKPMINGGTIENSTLSVTTNTPANTENQENQYY